MDYIIDCIINMDYIDMDYIIVSKTKINMLKEM